ncbi:hypothetical protein [Actinoplanes sp. L3-i22]|uniref:hypothetical protein n=1 Tax=Actinoplanes sp. L3-i22 TaxID=2836373 RepID=UPI001C75FA04|nr:hypothetical protein [Actinoplanes sp. L3-i22]BCY07510.1 hypothetical protein L3i22_025980 [Actinoplanes sp. L3-i22]
MAILAPPYRPFSPGFPPLDPARGEGGATIAVTMRYAPLAFVLGLFTPVLEIDGKDVPAGWSRVTTPVAFGEHHVHVHIPYLLPSRIGAAETTVVALPGRTAELEYRAPMLAFLRGALGPPPQKYPGLVLAVVLFVVAVVLAVCGCLGIFTSGGPESTVGAVERFTSGGPDSTVGAVGSVRASSVSAAPPPLLSAGGALLPAGVAGSGRWQIWGGDGGTRTSGGC